MASTKEFIPELAERTASREGLVRIAEIAEQAQRYEEMAEAMKAVAKLGVGLTAEERSLLTIGCKGTMAARRASLRNLSWTELLEEAAGDDGRLKMIREYKQKVESELSDICNDVVALIDQHLIPSSSSAETFVFYYRMKGDFYRYSAEFKTGNDRNEAAEQSLKAYQTASSTAEVDLSPIHPGRLGLALNFSVLYYEIMDSAERACQLAKQAFDEALAEFDTLREEYYEENSLIMKILRNNLTFWTDSVPNDGDDATKENAAKGAAGEAAERVILSALPFCRSLENCISLCNNLLQALS